MPEAAGQLFLVSDGKPVSLPELLHLIAAAQGRSARLIPVPPGLLRALLAMIGLTAMGAGNTASPQSSAVTLYAWVAVRGLGLLAGVSLATRYGLPWLTTPLARSNELLVLFALTWAIALAAGADALGFSKEVGAFLAGVSLASTPYRDSIAGRLVTLRDFLLLFFFWEGVGLASYLLIGFWFTRRSASSAAQKAFVVNRIGDLAFGLGLACVAEEIAATRLAAADELFVTSTAGGIMPVTLLDGRPVGGGTPGPITQRIHDLYWSKKEAGWLSTPVDYGEGAAGRTTR